MLLWVNLHAGYAAGLAFLALFLIGDALDAAFGITEKALVPRLRRLLLVIAACVAVVPLNPYGSRLYRYPFETLHSRTMQAYISEWHSPDFHQARYLPFLLMMLATLVLPALSPRRLRVRDSAAALGHHVRGAAFCPSHTGLCASCRSAPQLHDSGSYWRQLVNRSLFGRSRHPNQSGHQCDVCWLGFLVFTGLRLGFVIRHQPAAEAREFPAAAASFLIRTQPPGPLLNHYNWGGYFIWKLYPAYPGFH